MLKLLKNFILFTLAFSFNFKLNTMESPKSKNILDSEIETLDFKQLLNYPSLNNREYLSKLYFLSTSLYTVKCVINSLELLSNLAKDLVESSMPERTTILLKRDQKLLSFLEENPQCKFKNCSEVKYDIGTTCSLTSSKAQALFFQLFKYPSKPYLYINDLINSKYSQISLIGKLKKHVVVKNVMTICTDKYGALSVLLIPEVVSISSFDLIKSMTIDQIINKIINFYEYNNLLAVLNKIIPDFIDLTKSFMQICKLFEYFNFSNRYSFMKISESETIYSYITNAFEKHKPKVNYYDSLYDQIQKEISKITIKLNTKERNFSDLSHARSILPKSLRLVVSKELDYKILSKSQNTETSDINSFIDDLVKPNKKAKKQNKQNKQNKKKNRTRPHKKQDGIAEKTEKQEEIAKELEAIKKEYFGRPEYAYRIYRWFNQEFIKDKSQDSILYHTYSPIADMFIKKYGEHKIQTNKTFGTQDTSYCMLGKIKYPNKTSELVLFVNCYNCKNICYHRGFERANISEMLQESFLFSFPNLTQVEEQECKSKSFMLFNLENKQDIYTEKNFKENDFCIYISDPKNNVTIVLFKPLQFN